MWAYNDLICPYLGVFNPIANISFIIDRVIEVVVRGEGKPASALVLSAHQEGWVQRQRVSDVLAVTLLRANLGPGEAEAIVLAQEIKASWVLLARV